MVVMQAIFKEGVAASYMYKDGQEPQSALRTSVRTFIVRIFKNILVQHGINVFCFTNRRRSMLEFVIRMQWS